MPPVFKPTLKSREIGSKRYNAAREKAKTEYSRATAARAKSTRGRSSSCPEGPSVQLPQYVNYYNTLGIPENSSQKAIKSRFMKLARTHHPDRNKVTK
jgi:hypothetical protein